MVSYREPNQKTGGKHLYWREPTLRSKHFLPLHSPLLRHSSLQLTSEELTILRDPALLPAWYPLPTAPTIQRRLRNIGDVLGAIMSSYPNKLLCLFLFCKQMVCLLNSSPLP